MKYHLGLICIKSRIILELALEKYVERVGNEFR
jgi:hypothetical protein